MNIWNAPVIPAERHLTPVVGYRCRACGHVSDPANGQESCAPLDSRCAGCGLPIPQAREPVGLAQVERHFEPLIWWDEIAA